MFLYGGNIYVVYSILINAQGKQGIAVMCRNAMRLIWKYCKCFVLLISPCVFICCKDYGAIQYDADCQYGNVIM